MGLFSRKSKNSRPVTKDSASFDSENSTSNHLKSIRSPSLNFSNGRPSANSLSIHSPLSPMMPHMPKIGLPKPPDPSLDAAGYLRSLGAVRERSKIITEKALKNRLNHFDVDLERFPDVVQFVCRIIKVCYMILLDTTSSTATITITLLGTTISTILLLLMIPQHFQSSRLFVVYYHPSPPIFSLLPSYI